MPRALRASVSHVPRALHTLMLYVPCTLSDLVYHLTRTLDPLVLLIPHLLQVPHAQHTLMHLMSRRSCVSHLLCFWYFSYLSFFVAWTTVNPYM